MRFRPLKTISTAFTVIIIILAFPATAILASWNALPGDFLYPVKRGLEKTALALVPNSFFEAELRLKLLDRRTNEVAQSITKAPGNTQALTELLAEAQAAELVTTELEPTSRTQASLQLLDKLTTTQQKLETTKQTVIQSNPTVTSQSTPSAPQPAAPAGSQPAPVSSPQTQPPPQPAAQTTPEQAQQTVESIENTQAELDQIIDQLEETIEQNLPSGIQEDSQPTGKSQSDHDKDKPDKKPQSKDKEDDHRDQDDDRH